MSDKGVQDGYQISHEALEKAIKGETQRQNVTVLTFETSGGSNKGENFTCVMIAIEVKALVDGQEKCFHYMAKCLPANAFRAKFITEVFLNFQNVHFSYVTKTIFLFRLMGLAENVMYMTS